DFYYLPIAPALPNIRDGKVVALAVSTAKRAPTLPDVPTVVEAGYPDAQYQFWGGLAVPAKTPRTIVDRLNAETQKALAVPAVEGRVGAFGVEPMPMTAGEVAQIYRDDGAAVGKLAQGLQLVPTTCRAGSPDGVRREAISAFTRVHSPSKTGVNALGDALWRSGAPLIRDRRGPKRSRVCSAPLRAALRPGHTS